MTNKEHLSKHDREMAEIRAILKRTAEQHQREAAKLWALLGKLATGTEVALRDLAAARKRTESQPQSLNRFPPRHQRPQETLISAGTDRAAWPDIY